MPFDHNINNRLVAKDNHRPCIPKPIDVNHSLPQGDDELTCNNTISTLCQLVPQVFIGRILEMLDRHNLKLSFILF